MASIWVVVGLIALAVAAIGVTAWGLRSDQIEAGVRETDRIATLLADQTNRSVAAIDAALEDVKARVDAAGLDTPEDFSRAVYTKDIFDFLTARLRQLPLATVITLQASDGALVNSTRQWPRPEANFADRDYFQHFGEIDDRTSIVSLPVNSRLVGTLTLYFSKRFNARNGEFRRRRLGRRRDQLFCQHLRIRRLGERPVLSADAQGWDAALAVSGADP